ncbi:MAG TPA: tol-pal system-associated acyl-CoA thioesterase [Thermopetrobacter sp.]|nr:tol-pal system-associated acyl-CoA thioesterase [Thermopetrobacter sp.]
MSAPRWPDLAGRITGRVHVLAVRVYYEDTDFSGAVYHANYLKFCERGRSDFLRLIGVHHHELNAADPPLGFVVRRMACEFLRPAAIDDVLQVRTEVAAATGARLILRQRVLRDGEELFRAEVTAALVDATGRPRRLPQELRDKLAPFTPRE